MYNKRHRKRIAFRGILTYRVFYRHSYYVKHPLTFWGELFRQSAAFLERGLYGWALADTWSLSHHFAEVIPDMVRRLRVDHEGGAGAPGYLIIEEMRKEGLHPGKDSETPEHIARAEQQWQEILEAIAQGFEAAGELANWPDAEDIPALTATMKTGLDLFRDYYDALWD